MPSPSSLQPPTLTFSSAACNRKPGALTTLPFYKLGAYATSSNIHILSNFDTTPKVIAALPAHQSSITSVKLISHSDIPVLLAASSDGRIVIWTRISSADTPKWTARCNWALHSTSCIALDAISTTSDLQLATTATDGSVLHAVLDDISQSAPRTAGCNLGMTPDGREVLPECIAIRPISTHCTLLAVGGTDRRIRLFQALTIPQHTLTPVTIVDGHRDWIRSLAFSSQGPSTDAFHLASASKDTTARIWHIAPAGDTLPEGAKPLTLDSFVWSISPVALLDEHTAPVHSVSFAQEGSLHLVTSSMDCSVAVWTATNNVWHCAARFGLMGGASAHALGFFGASFVTQDARVVLGHNFGGALHLWRAEPGTDDLSTSYAYIAHSAPGGHFGPVMDLEWEPRGRYLLSVSTDKTSRIFAQVDEEGETRFVEWARPQVHGHSLFAAAFCDAEGRRYVSGGEERMLRVFDAPGQFATPGESATNPSSAKPLGACVPELGLSNKAVFAAEGAKDEPVDNNLSDMTISSFGASRASSIAPLEEELKQNRLWPEVAKLYGHGNEISCVSVDITNGVMASACRAQAAKDATIILWDVNSGVECGRLDAHELTVNQLQFSMNGCYLLSVSRDRSAVVFRRTDPEARFAYKRVMHAKGAHSRLIYTCCWILQDRYFATGGRDKCLKVFEVREGDGQPNRTTELLKEKFSSGVSAVDSASIHTGLENARDIIAVGLENGTIQVFSIETNLTQAYESAPILKSLLQVDPDLRCGARITRLQWRPNLESVGAELEQLQLGVASEDLSVRVYSFKLGAVAK